MADALFHAAWWPKLSADQMKRFDEASALVPEFRSGLATPLIRRLVFGGHGMVAWGEQPQGRSA